MQSRNKSNISLIISVGVLSFLLASCSAGGGDAPLPAPPDSGGGTPAPSPAAGILATPEETAHFLTQATFGPNADEIASLTGGDVSQWFVDELSKPATLNLPYVLNRLSEPDAYPDALDFELRQTPGHSFFINAITANDQLRQRMAFALSQIFVVSNSELTSLNVYPETIAHFQDILVANAFGNYRDILEEVTYSPAMGVYLTYLQNQRGDPSSGRVPDENYAREIMQLFSIGLIQLNPDGTPVTDGSGEPIETYTNEDITGLARVFTGLSLQGGGFFDDFSPTVNVAHYSPMVPFEAFHSELEKSFLGTTIPAGTGATESIDQAIDVIFAHPNVAPFVSRQLIQRFTTSHPEPAYVARVTAAFEAGSFTLPDGRPVGTGERGDLAATIAAVLLDAEARDANARADADFGKPREPVIRFVNWARAFDVGTVTPRHTFPLFDTSSSAALGQHPYRSPSVFNFYRPGYVAPGTETGAANLTIPELQLLNATSVAGYANFMSYFIFARAATEEVGETAASFIPDYADELALADDPASLVDRIDLLLAYGALTEETETRIENVISGLPLTIAGDPSYDGATFRVQTAVFLAMNAPEYLVQK